jgi:hypothetical protein
VITAKVHRRTGLTDSDAQTAVAAPVSSRIPGNGTFDFRHPASSMTLGSGRMTALPSGRFSQTNRCLGPSSSASRISDGTVVCPLSVKVDVNMQTAYHMNWHYRNKYITK